MNIFRPEQSEIATGSTDNDKLTTKGYVDEKTSTVYNDMSDPTGIVDSTTSTLSFINGSRTFSINPTVTNFDYYIKGVKYTTTGDSKVISTTEGMHFLYYDGATLDEIALPSFSQLEDLILTKVLVAIIYWDNTNTLSKVFDERHGITMDGQTHLHLHLSLGAQYVSGLAPGDFSVDQSGDVATHAQFSVATGTIRDEDIQLTLNTIGSTTGLEIWYLVGTDWRWTTNAGFSVLTTGTGRLAFNNSGAQTEVTNNNFVLCHIFAANTVAGDPIVIQGQNEYTNINNARAGAEIEISNLILSGLPSPEFKAVGTVIFQTSDGYANAVKGRVRSTDLGEDYVDFRTSPLNSTVTASNHGSLSGLPNDDHTQYALLSGRSGGQTWIGGTGSGEDAVIESTSDATKGLVKLQPNGGNVTVGSAVGAAGNILDIEQSLVGSSVVQVKNTNSGGSMQYEANNDLGYNIAIGMLGSTAAVGVFVANSGAILASGYAALNIVNDGNNPIDFATDVTDSHALAATVKLRLQANGLLTSLVTNYETLVVADDDIPNRKFVTDLVAGAIILQGDWNASTNTPDITSTTTVGLAWRVSVAGSTDLGGITDWEVGDLAVKTATGWIKIDNEDIDAVWGNITGTLSNQTDLQGELDAKEPTLAKGNLTEVTSSVLTIVGGTSSVIGSGTSIEVDQADTSNSGYLSSTDWNTFNNKANTAPASVPATPTSTGVQGDWSFGSGYMYRCVTTNVWVRWAVATTW